MKKKIYNFVFKYYCKTNFLILIQNMNNYDKQVIALESHFSTLIQFA